MKSNYLKRSALPRKRRPGTRRGPARSKKYLAFIRKQPCVCCGTTTRVEAAHTGPHGLSAKSSDFSCIALCDEHHRLGKWAHHGTNPVIWAAHWELDVPALIVEFNERFAGVT